MARPVVLSLFPGIGLLDMAFEAEGFTVVRGPDVLWGGDVHTFHPPAGVFDGVIGGPPCQAFSTLANLVRAKGHEPRFGNLIPEFERCVAEAAPAATANKFCYPWSPPMPRRAKSPAMHLVDGTARAGRETERLVPPIDAPVTMPDWLPEDAVAVWDRKVAKLGERGVDLRGCEDSLAMLCALESALQRRLKAGEIPKAAMMHEWRALAGEFYETPASQVRAVPGRERGKAGKVQRDPEEEYRL